MDKATKDKYDKLTTKEEKIAFKSKEIKTKTKLGKFTYNG